MGRKNCNVRFRRTLDPNLRVRRKRLRPEVVASSTVMLDDYDARVPVRARGDAVAQADPDDQR